MVGLAVGDVTESFLPCRAGREPVDSSLVRELKTFTLVAPRMPMTTLLLGCLTSEELHQAFLKMMKHMKAL
ncbi:unnamed protein product [Closterium sp. NIES-65]|nr:unnamed protein product [Closterium sp. NIES-65]